MISIGLSIWNVMRTIVAGGATFPDDTTNANEFLIFFI